MATCVKCGYIGFVEQAIVEGSVLFLCKKCFQYGDAVPMRRPNPQEVERKLTFHRRKRFPPREMETKAIVSGYHEIVKRARERMGKTQMDVASALAEKSSVIQRVENGNLEPPLKLAKKLEQYFKITLVKDLQEEKKEEVKEFSLSDGGLTIGDLVKMKDPKK